jgi:integrase
MVPLGDFKHAWNTVRTAAGHLSLRIHDSRHISATDMINAGTPRTVINAVAGWKTDMLRTYYHLDSDAALSHIQWPRSDKREASVKPEIAEAI